MVVNFEIVGFLAVTSAFFIVSRKRFPVPQQARLPMYLLLSLLAFNHAANILEHFWGAVWADSIADDLSLATPLLWALFLVEIGRSHLSSQVAGQSEQLSFLIECVPASVAWLDSEQRLWKPSPRVPRRSKSWRGPSVQPTWDSWQRERLTI